MHRHTFVGVDVSLLPPDAFPGYHEMRELTAALLRSAAEISVTPPAPQAAAPRLTVRIGLHSVRVHGQWQIVFRWSEGGADEVRLVDYH